MPILWSLVAAQVVLTTTSGFNGPLTRYVKLRVAHAPGMPWAFSPPPRVSDPDMHHGTCVTHVPWCMPGSITSGFLWSRLRGKRSRHSQRMCNPQFYVSGKRPMSWRHHVAEIPTFHVSTGSTSTQCSSPESFFGNRLSPCYKGKHEHQLNGTESQNLYTCRGVNNLFLPDGLWQNG